mmetsp:Transcript_10778/g.30304  ORF Transcript_10778/g.30304 Transcript_10778/m.30304 type:complete len:201 (-) Transcript_10778:185-787(-)
MDCPARVLRPVYDGLPVNGQKGHGYDSVAQVIHQDEHGNPDRFPLFRRQRIEVSDAPLELQSSDLRRGVVSVVQTREVHREFEQDVMYNILFSPRRSTHLSRTDGPLVIVHKSLRDNEPTVGASSMNEILGQIDEGPVPLHELGERSFGYVLVLLDAVYGHLEPVDPVVQLITVLVGEVLLLRSPGFLPTPVALDARYDT